MSFTYGISFAMIAVGPVVLSNTVTRTCSGLGLWFGPFYMLWQWKETPCPNS